MNTSTLTNSEKNLQLAPLENLNNFHNVKISVGGPQIRISSKIEEEESNIDRSKNGTFLHSTQYLERESNDQSVPTRNKRASFNIGSESYGALNKHLK